LSGPIALLLVLWLVWVEPGRSRRDRWPRPPEQFLPAFASKDRQGHWNGIREMAMEVRGELQDLLTRLGDRATVKDLANMQARVESLEANTANYEDTWSLGRSFWDQRNRNRWDGLSRERTDRPTHAWAVPLWERVEYVMSWVYQHPPESPRPPKYPGMDAWGESSDMGWS
jgi:hypothetical protein